MVAAAEVGAVEAEEEAVAAGVAKFASEAQAMHRRLHLRKLRQDLSRQPKLSRLQHS